MPEEEINWHEILDNKLKSVPTKSIEEAVAKSVGELNDVEYDCCIDNINYIKRQEIIITLTLSEVLPKP